MTISPNQFTILESLADGPRWMRSFQTVKPLLEHLLQQGLVERCRPHLGRGSNMVRLTVAGCTAIEVAPTDVPSQRDERSTIHEAKRWEVGSIRPGCTGFQRESCEAFLRHLKSGSTVPEAVGYLAAADGVQRPAIWRRLRDGGVISPLRAGRPRATRARALTPTELSAAAPSPVDRDPCPRCGVRGDVGCQHSRAPIGMMM